MAAFSKGIKAQHQHPALHVPWPNICVVSVKGASTVTAVLAGGGHHLCMLSIGKPLLYSCLLPPPVYAWSQPGSTPGSDASPPAHQVLVTSPRVCAGFQGGPGPPPAEAPSCPGQGGDRHQGATQRCDYQLPALNLSEIGE
jgi:hypothetical protein